MAQFAHSFTEKLRQSQQAIVIALRGDLGSGKTTFVQNVAKSLGINEDVTSPTFVIQKTYEIPKKSEFKKLVHVDAYRLDSAEDLTKLGFQDVLKDKESVVFIEWPEKISSVLPKDVEYIDFKFIDETKREIKYADKE